MISPSEREVLEQVADAQAAAFDRFLSGMAAQEDGMLRQALPSATCLACADTGRLGDDIPCPCEANPC